MSNEDYILGADDEELNRLHLQHEVWLSEAEHGWTLANFKAGQTILDLGSGPGYCSVELSKIVRNKGKIICIDKSKHFIDYLNQVKKLKQLPIKPVLSSFDNFDYGINTLDGLYCRWALAWISNPKEILEKISKALVPQGKMVIQEYYDWSTHQTKPEMPALKYAIAKALESFKNTDSEIDIGAYIPKILTELGLEICSIRLMSKIAKPDSKVWGWPTTFYNSYFPRLKSMGFITNHEEEQAYRDIKTLSKLPYATICCPLMVEVIAQKT